MRAAEGVNHFGYLFQKTPHAHATPAGIKPSRRSHTRQGGRLLRRRMASFYSADDTVDEITSILQASQSEPWEEGGSQWTIQQVV